MRELTVELEFERGLAFGVRVRGWERVKVKVRVRVRVTVRVRIRV